jgi:hypothetical protein
MWVRRHDRLAMGMYHVFELYIKHTKAIQSAIAELQFRAAGMCSG